MPAHLTSRRSLAVSFNPAPTHSSRTYLFGLVSLFALFLLQYVSPLYNRIVQTRLKSLLLAPSVGSVPGPLMGPNLTYSNASPSHAARCQYPAEEAAHEAHPNHQHVPSIWDGSRTLGNGGENNGRRRLCCDLFATCHSLTHCPPDWDGCDTHCS